MAVSTRAAEAGKTFSEAISAGVAAMTVPRLTRVVYHAGSAMAPALNAAAAVAAPPARRKAAAAASTAAAAAAAATTAATTASSSSPPLPPIEGLLVRVLPSPSAASVAVGDVVAFHAPAVSPEEARAVGAWPSEGQAGVRFFVFELGEERGRESRGESDFFFSPRLEKKKVVGREKKLVSPQTHQQHVELLDLILNVLRQPVELDRGLREADDGQGVGEELLVLLDEEGDTC